jgi:hypothetical protein
VFRSLAELEDALGVNLRKTPTMIASVNNDHAIFFRIFAVASGLIGFSAALINRLDTRRLPSGEMGSEDGAL